VATSSTPQRRSAVRFRERAELLDFLLGVADATSETLDLDRLLGNVASIVKQVIPSDLFAILLYSEKVQGMKIRYSMGHRDEVVRGLVIPLGEGITGAAAATRLPILVDDVRGDVRYISALDAVRSELAVPMIARGKLVGVIDVQATRVKAYTEHDRALLRLIASRVAVAIDNARLYRRVERQNRTLRVLAHLSQEFSSILHLDELLRKIAKTIRALISYDSFSVMLVDPERQGAAAPLQRALRPAYRSRQHPDRQGHHRRGGGSARADSRERHDGRSALHRVAPEIRSEVAVPLIVQDRVVGVMDLESERMGYFTDDHVRMLTLLAPQIASSVENARLYEELKDREQRMDQDLKRRASCSRFCCRGVLRRSAGWRSRSAARAAREITGDVYDFFEHGAEYAVLAFGDVSGKGRRCGAVRRAGERIAANAGAAPPRSGRFACDR
jgi:phosphoserine phosphatase RsbU/P